MTYTRFTKRRTSKASLIATEQLIAALHKHDTMTGVLTELGLTQHSSNRYSVKRIIEERGLSSISKIQHYLGSNRGRKFPNNTGVKLEDVLVQNCNYNRGHLKRRLIKTGLLKNECSICQQPPMWRGQPLVMILDHVNGINNDNRLDNLRLLCPHCNSQTDTFCGRNIKK